MLARLVDTLGGHCAVLEGDGPEINDVQIDSRRIEAGNLFVALPGAVNDGARYIPQAIERGASAVLAPESVENTLLRGPGGDVVIPLWVHPGARAVAGRAAALVHEEPACAMKVIAITGTNGKTTTAFLIGHLLEACGFTPAVLGTAGHRLADGVLLPTAHTTPDAPELQRLIRRHRELGGDSVVLEVSSHALVQERIAGLDVSCAVFTNLSRDHLDYHRDMDSYARAKARLFEGLGEGAVAVLNADDDAHQLMASAARESGARVLTYGTASQASLRATETRIDTDATYLTLSGMGFSPARLRLSLLGRFNVSNALAASAAVLLSGAGPSALLEGLATVTSPPGRLERIENTGKGFHVFVDYAHTEDALRGVLTALREALGDGPGRLLLAFGCGGERDPGKRAPMGRVASELADVVVVTSDNPRGEDPQKIINDIRAGLTGGAEVHLEVDRRLAIGRAVGQARPGDVVLIVGKGHETVQEIGAESLAFDDREVAREVLS